MRILDLADGYASNTPPTIGAQTFPATAVTFDNSGTDFDGDDLQEVLEEVDMALKVKPAAFLEVVVDASADPIDADGGAFLQIAASTAQTTRRVSFTDDIGELICLYTGAAASETLLATFPRGGAEKNVNIPAGTRLSIRAYGADAIDSGFLIITLENYV